MYTPEAMQHFLKPRNVGALADADGAGSATNAACGDTVRVTVSIKDGVISAVRFHSEACAGGIASCSAATEWANGKSIDEVRELDAAAVSTLLGGLPEAKLGCAEMAATALVAAVEDAS